MALKLKYEDITNSKGNENEYVPAEAAVKVNLFDDANPDSTIDSFTVTYADNFPTEELETLVRVYGIKKIIQDRTSSVSEVAEKFEKMRWFSDVVFKEQQRWNAKREHGPRQVAPEVEALAELFQTTVASIQFQLSKYTAEQKKQVFEDPKVAAKVAEIKNRTSGGEGLDLLAGLGASA